jgi:hypothetical protein
MTINNLSGMITGSFIHSDLTRPAYQGVIIQKGAHQGASGYFMSRSTPVTYLGESGRVEVRTK